MRTRREIFKGLSATVAAATLPHMAMAETEDIIDCRKLAQNLADAMKESKGGVWRVTVDKDFILISQISWPLPAPSIPG